MAIYHFSAKPFSRGSGQSTVAASAYRSCDRMVDERTGRVHDYRFKRGHAGGGVILPGGGTLSRSDLWNAVEANHTRGDAIVARELELALPNELTLAQNMVLVDEFSLFVSNLYRVGVQFDIHSKADSNDNSDESARDYSPHDPRNIHAHLMQTACHVDSQGELGNKCLELDPIHCSRAKILNQMQCLRPVWEDMCNSALVRAGHAIQIDHRTLEAQGIDRRPTFHLGPSASAIERNGISSRIRQREVARSAAEQAQAVAEAQAEAKSQLEVARLESALEEARAIELASRARTRPEVESELTRLLTEIARIDAFVLAAPSLARQAPTYIELAAARKNVLPAAKRASQARLNSVVLTEELSSLGWWRPLRRATLTKELEGNRRKTNELEDRALKVQECAKMKRTKEDIAHGVKMQTQRKGDLVTQCQSLEIELQAIQALEVFCKPAWEPGLGATKPRPQEGRAQTPQRDAGPPARIDRRNTQDIPECEPDRSSEYERPRGG